MNIIITSPSLNLHQNVSGVAAVTSSIIKSNTEHQYRHFEIGKRDHEKRNIRWLLKFFKLYLKWIKTLITSDFDLIHYNFPIDKRSVLRDAPLILLARFFGKKLIIHVHGGEYMLNTNTPVWAEKLLTQVFSGNNPVIFLSKEEKQFATNKYNCKHAFVLPNAINLKDAISFQRNSQNFEQLKFLFLGRICEEKGLNFIYHAFEELTRRGLKIRFTLAGKGPEENLFINKFKELLGENFIFKGVVGGQEKIDLLKENNVFLLPSFFEGLPISLLEAMSYAQIPIVTNVGAIPKIVTNHHNGLIVNVKSAESISRAIEVLMNQEIDLFNLSQNARKTIFDTFDLDIYIENLNKIYQYE